MKTILHKSDTRGYANHGWLETYHSFSFADYYDRERIHFGALRVLNDDIVAGGQGFGMHPHDNMEIITIPLEGDLEHKDSMGNSGVISSGEIQLMSAGKGILHSEFNKNSDRDVKLLQIWVFPNKQNVEPRYDQISIKDFETENEFFQIVSPDKNGQGSWIHQDAWFHLGNLKAGAEKEYAPKGNNHGVYVFVIDGDVIVEGQELNKRDGMGVYETDKIKVSSKSNSRVLLMEVPMLLH